MTDYLTTIGLEFHAELKTNTKIFCSCPTTFAAEPNTNVCPVCLGLPGVLPVLNKHAVELAVRAGLALNCQINDYSKFDRKNYFYPDLTKAYQISQLPLPICLNGYVDIETADGKPKRIRINRIHMEEDAGKLVHSGDNIANSQYSLPDYNRAAVPLVEIVTEPDLSSAFEARQFGEKLKLILEYAGVSDVKMEQGSLRCDVNISLRAKEEDELGVKVEIKNLNSFKAVQKAIEYEEVRQADMLDDKETIIQETRLWSEASGKTQSMRSKEDAHDYRYFPEPDLVPIRVDAAWMAEIAAGLPELPAKRLARLTEQYQLSDYDAAQITASPLLAFYFDEVMAVYPQAKTVANWLLGDISRLLNSLEAEPEQIPLSLEQFVYVLQELDKSAINNNSAKVVIEELFTAGGLAADIIKAKGFAQISDTSFLEAAIAKIIEANPKPVADYRAGKKQSIGFLVGQIMKETKGQANPGMVKEMLEKTLDN